MKVTFEHFKELDSTSKEIHRRINKVPSVLAENLCVSASTQTEGRGQIGKAWESLPGNIHLSLAFKLRSSQKSVISLVPLFIAKVLKKFFLMEFRIRLTTKWPNDLLFGGNKIAGILCEGYSEEQDLKGVIVGVGINVGTAVKGSDYSSVSLSQIRKCDTSEKGIENLAKTIAETLFLQWGGFSEKSSAFLRSEFEKSWLQKKYFLHVPGEASSFSYVESISSEGFLKLRSLLGERRVLQSASNEYKLSTQYPEVPIILADIGNTASKFAVVENRKLRRSLLTKVFVGNVNKKTLSQELEDWCAHVSNILPSSEKGWPIYAVSVAPSSFSDLSDVLAEKGFKLVNLMKERFLSYGQYPLNLLGADRLCLIEGYLSQVKPLVHLSSEGHEDELQLSFLVSLGTATTVDAVDNRGCHHGGIILPGMQTALKTLHTYGSLLPKIDLEDSFMGSLQNQSLLSVNPDLPTSTHTAILQGNFHLTWGAIISFICQCLSSEELNNKKYSNINIVLTGGYAETLKKILSQQIHIYQKNYFDGMVLTLTWDPLLTLKGTHCLVTGGEIFE